MTVKEPASPYPATLPDRGTTLRIFAGAVFLYIFLQGGLLLLPPRLGLLPGGLITVLVMLAAALVLERLFFGRGFSNALRVLGYGRPAGSALLAAAVVTLILVTFFPLYSAVSGVPVGLAQNWPVTLLSIFIVNGLGEETLFRGWVFGQLRRDGRSFICATLLSMILFAAVHLMLFVSNPFFVGLIGTLIAITSSLPMAYMFERGNNTIWAPVILHMATHTVRLVSIPDAQYMTVVIGWLLLQIFGLYLVFLFRGLLERRRTAPAALQP